MTATPMRSAIRILAASPLVEKISLDHEKNSVKVYYKSNDKYADSIRDIIDVINYYFKNEHNASGAFRLIGKEQLKKKENYYINSYGHSRFELFRIDIQDEYMTDDYYYDTSNDVVAIELICFGHARDFIFGELRKRESGRRGVIEFNYANFRDPERQARYVAEWRQLAPTMAKNLDVSLVRIADDTPLEEINETLEDLRKYVAEPCLSVYFDANFTFINKVLHAEASRIFVTVDFNRIRNDSDITALNELMNNARDPENVFIIQYNIEKDAQIMIGRRGNELRYSGRQIIRRK